MENYCPEGKDTGAKINVHVYTFPNVAPYRDRYLMNVSAARDDAVALTAHIQPTRVSWIGPSPLLQPQSELSQSLAWTTVDASEWVFLPLFHTDLSKHKSNHVPSLNKTLRWVPIMKKSPNPSSLP